LISLFVLCGALFFTVPANGQAPCQTLDDYRWCTFNAGGGVAPVWGREHSNFYRGWNFHAGAGLEMTGRPAPGRKWRFFLTANFMFDQLRIQPTALQRARILNPTDVGLLEATGGKAKFYSTTLDPTLRFPVRGRFSAYLFTGFGWLRRDLEFTGPSTQGALLQPGGPAVFGNGGNSGACDAGAGLNFRLSRGLMLYAEGRILHGLAVNNASTLVPISAGIRW
jgi:hypothetical protein